MCAAGVQVRLHYATTQQGRQLGREELLTHLGLDRHFQAARASNFAEAIEYLKDSTLLPAVQSAYRK